MIQTRAAPAPRRCLRGQLARLGSGNTLVLLNGRRIASYGISSTENSVPELSPDVNVLPNIGLERVDVLRDGASSLYGSDAVAGVINFVTDNRYQGTEATVQTRYAEVGSVPSWVSTPSTARTSSVVAHTGRRCWMHVSAGAVRR